MGHQGQLTYTSVITGITAAQPIQPLSEGKTLKMIEKKLVTVFLRL